MRHIALLIALLTILPGISAAQDDLSMSDENTTVTRISFRFPESRTFDSERLSDQIATKSPGFVDRLKQRLDFLPFVAARAFEFDPIELQRDVIRLRRFYDRNGFPNASVDYPASQFDRNDNEIHVIFTIREGPPLELEEVSLTVNGSLSEETEKRWPELKQDLEDRSGTRYTEFERLSIENEILSLLQDRGYAFSTVETDAQPDNAKQRVRLNITVQPGPHGRISEIILEGNEHISDNTVLRELPLEPGDEYSRKRLIQGQRELFGLNLFRLALADVPDQPKDSSVVIRYRVREIKPRYVSLQGGYSRETGLTVESNLRHRNFFGGARQFSISSAVQPGVYSRPATGRKPVRSVSANVSLRQPYVFTTELSASVSPFYNWQDDPNQNTRFYELGVTSGLVAEILPFRTISTQYTFGRAVPLIDTGLGGRFDIYDRSILSAGASLGRLDDFLNPRRGFLIRPFIESGGLVGASGVQYFKSQITASGFLPLTSHSSISLSVSTGKLWPVGKSRDQQEPQTEFRFDGIRFYAGGASDVRGWGLNLVGPQAAVADTIIAETDGTWSIQNARYEAIGGEAKLVGQLELRLPAPWLGSAWNVAGFLDFGAVSSHLETDADGRIIFTDSGVARFRDKGIIHFSDLKFGTGAGIRYKTPVGMLRLDLAYKLNPSVSDLQDADQRALFEAGLRDTQPDSRTFRRFNLHLSIGRTF